jgi:phosphoglycolate phosphatase-like HAD superfamily hydrolase
MVPLMVEMLEECPGHEPRDELERVVIHFVDHLTGKQTIFQMLRLVEEIQRRGGTPREALEYKAEYHRRLMAHIAARIEDLREGRKKPVDFLVPGARPLLEALVRADVECYVASGTDVEFVREEVHLLGLEEFFGDRVFGALSNYRDYSKDKVIRDILAKHDLSGANLLVVGDGYVEIQNGRDVDAVTWGVYTAEKNRYHMNENKRGRLFRAGAHLLSRDLSECDAVLRHLEVGGR